MSKYQTRYVIPDHMPIGEVKDLIEDATGSAEVVTHSSGVVPDHIDIIWETGGDFHEFDVMDALQELNANHDIHIERPSLVVESHLDPPGIDVK